MHDVALAEIHAPKHNKQLLLQVYAETAEFIGRKINILVDNFDSPIRRTQAFAHSVTRHRDANRPRSLDLFSGTNSVGNHLKNWDFLLFPLTFCPKEIPTFVRIFANGNIASSTLAAILISS